MIHTLYITLITFTLTIISVDHTLQINLSRYTLKIISVDHTLTINLMTLERISPSASNVG